MTPARDPALDGTADRAAGWHPTLLIAIASLLAVMPLLRHGCSCGHDFDFHLLSWMEAARQFSEGNIHPHWAFSPAFNAGEPRFVFYPPLSWYLGGLLGLLLEHLPAVSGPAAWNAAPIVFTWMALSASGLTMYRLARRYAGPNAALLAATLYLANPYMLFTAYERTAYAELLAAAWIPLLYEAILGERVTVARVALPIALLWLTNAPAAVMGSYTLVLLAALRVTQMYWGERAAPEPWRTRHRESLAMAATSAAGGALGLALAAFYIVPAAYQRRFVQIAMATITGMRIDQNFLFEHTGTTGDALLHDQVLHTASVIAVVLLAAAAFAIVAASRRQERTRAFPTATLAILTGSIAFLLTRFSLPIWSHAPEATFLQFPWRLLAMLAPVVAVSAAAACERWGMKPVVAAAGCILLAIGLTHPAYHAFRQPCDVEDTATARLALFLSNAGTDATDEYTPVTADNDALAPGDPPFWLAPDAKGSAPAGSRAGSAPLHFRVTAPRAEYLVLNLRNYPAWQVLRNGSAVPTRAARSDGLIAIPVDAGSTTIDIRYMRSFDEKTGDVVSLLALGCLVFALRRTA